MLRFLFLGLIAWRLPHSFVYFTSLARRIVTIAFGAFKLTTANSAIKRWYIDMEH